MKTTRKTPFYGPLKAAVLDWAGTAVDYGCIGPVVAFREVFRSRFIEPTYEEVRASMGLDKMEHLRVMGAMPRIRNLWTAIYGKELVESDFLEMYQHFEELRISALPEHSTLVPGLLNTVSTLRGMGLRIGSTTGYNTVVTNHMRAEAAKLGYWPDCVVCASDVPAGRPHPWMCLRNAMELGVYPMASMVKVGDTVHDILEGLNAGMWTVAVTTSGNEMGLSHAEVQEMDPAALARRQHSIATRMQVAGAHFVVEDILGVPAVIEEINQLLAQGIRPEDDY